MARPRLEKGDRVPPTVTESEMEAILALLQSKKRALGSDGCTSGGALRELFDLCLRYGQFPRAWKEGRLCLLHKGSRPPDSASAVVATSGFAERGGKAMEKIMATRLVRHLEEGSGPELSESQFGFRPSRPSNV
nr:uncharacterized protein LOC116774191 [Danaus plexippus plexippus]